MITIDITQRCFRRDGTDGEGRVRIAFNAGHFETCEVVIDRTDCGVMPIQHKTFTKSGLARTLEVAAQLLADDMSGSREGEQHARFFGVAGTVVETEDRPGTLRVEEVAELLGIARSTVYQQINEGKIPSLKFGRARRVSQSVVNHLLAEGTMPKRSPAEAEAPAGKKRPCPR